MLRKRTKQLGWNHLVSRPLVPNESLSGKILAVVLKRTLGTKSRMKTPPVKKQEQTIFSSSGLENLQLNLASDKPENLDFSSADQLIRCIKAAAEVKLDNEAFWKKAISGVLDVRSSLSSIESVELLWIFAGMRKLDRQLFGELLHNIQTDLNRLKTAKLVTLLWTLQECNYRQRSLFAAISEVRWKRISLRLSH